MNDKLSIEEIINSGNGLILDLISQIVDLNEIQKKENPPHRSILSSSVILSFSILEAYVNYISALIVSEHKRSKPSPQIKKILNDIEIDILLERKSYFDPQIMQVKIKNNSFLPILDKLVVIPRLLAKAYSEDINIDRGGKSWEYIRQLKEKRDEIAHPKFDVKKIEPIINLTDKLDHQKPAYTIEPIVLLNGLIGLRYYLQINGDLLIKIFKGKFSSFTFTAIDIFIRKTIISINNTYSIHENDFENSLEDEYRFEESSNEKLEASMKYLTSS